MSKSNKLEKEIRKRLVEKKMSVSELARRAKISRPHIYNIMRGDYSNESMLKVARVLRISPATLAALRWL